MMSLPVTPLGFSFVPFPNACHCASYQTPARRDGFKALITPMRANIDGPRPSAAMISAAVAAVRCFNSRGKSMISSCRPSLLTVDGRGGVKRRPFRGAAGAG
jgi:hypothetical protein